MLRLVNAVSGKSESSSEASSAEIRQPRLATQQPHEETQPTNVAELLLLSRFLTTKGNGTRKALTTIRPPPGFEHLGPRFLASNGYNTQKPVTVVRPPPGFEHLGVRKVAGNGQYITLPAQDECTPRPELRYLCPPSHPSQKESQRCPQAGTTVDSSRPLAPRRHLQKRLRVQSCVDCVVVPYMRVDYEEKDDFILFDELHQVATF